MKPLCKLGMLLAGLGLPAMALAVGGWDPAKKETETAKQQKAANPKVAQAIADIKNKDPSVKRFFDSAHGYAVFPTVAKGGIGIGGAYGEGEVYERGRLVGTASLTQVTIGFQLGGQAYSEFVFFKDKKTLDDFKKGNFELSAQASAVAATAGAGANADYDKGVAIFTLVKGGLMYEASVGGQKFSFAPK